MRGRASIFVRPRISACATTAMTDSLPNSAATPRRNPDGLVLKLLISSILFALLIAILIPALSWLQAGRYEVKARRCPSNLRQIGLAMMMYANDHKGQLPPTPDLLIDPAGDGLAPETFVCPFSHDHAATGNTTSAIRADFALPGHNSYVFTDLTGRADDLTIDHVLAYDNPANHGGDGVNALFGDGHVEFLDAQRTAHLLSELKAGHNPPRRATTEGSP